MGGGTQAGRDAPHHHALDGLGSVVVIRARSTHTRPDSFRPVPSVDAAVFRVVRREPPLLPDHMADAYAIVRTAALAVASHARMEEAWSVPDVYLLTDGPEGEIAVPHLSLAFLEDGLELAKADGDPVWEAVDGPRRDVAR